MTPIRFGAFEVDAQSMSYVVTKEVQIQEQPFQVLILLVERPGEVLTREELARRLWSEQTNVDFERGLDKAITRLREALRDWRESSLRGDAATPRISIYCACNEWRPWR